VIDAISSVGSLISRPLHVRACCSSKRGCLTREEADRGSCGIVDGGDWYIQECRS
jgi:hypothetical protein